MRGIEWTAELLEAMVREAFDLEVWITGTLSGGVEPVREIADVTVGTEALSVAVKWYYPKYGGLSDRRYRVSDPARIHEDVFSVIDQKLCINGKVVDHSTDPFPDLVATHFSKFCTKWRLRNTL